MMPETLPGDCGLSRGTSMLSKAIIFFEKLMTGDADVSHVFGCIGDDQCLEALPQGVRVSFIKKYETSKFEIWRLPLDDSDRKAFRIGSVILAGEAYGWTKIPLHAADSLGSFISRIIFRRKRPFFWFTKKFGIFSVKDCSQLFYYSILKFTKYRILDDQHKEAGWREMTPDHLHDLLSLPHNSAVKIYENKPAEARRVPIPPR